VDEMNQTLLDRYNEVDRDDSNVFFVGDMSFGRGSRKPKWWLSQLRGHITYFKGSHDHGIRPTNMENCHDDMILDTGVGKVYIVHEPARVPSDWNGWVIHGHTHDTRLISRPRHVCVCVEAIDYRPISLDQIREAIKNEIHSKEVHTMRR
jgi:calcineurin-like phosphoesterase family protein